MAADVQARGGRRSNKFRKHLDEEIERRDLGRKASAATATFRAASLTSFHHVRSTSRRVAETKNNDGLPEEEGRRRWLSVEAGLEQYSETELDTTHGTAVLCRDDVGDFARRAILTINAIIGFTQIRMIEEIEEISPKLKLHALGN